MTPDNRSLILHQYDMSPFSEKVRVIFGIKRLTWFACNQPSIMPKPDLIALTGGYRRIPVLQIGADLYFDSLLIIEELERRFPEPSVLAPGGPGLSAALTTWTDQPLFMTIVGLLFGGDWEVSAAFIEDRAQLMGRPFDPAAMAVAAPQLTLQLRLHLDLIERQLQDGRPFLSGKQPGLVDASVYHNIIFMRWGRGRTAQILNEFPRLLAWEARVRALGHGIRHDMSPADAIRIARETIAVAPSLPQMAGFPEFGSRVEFCYNDANTPPLDATLVSASAQELVLRPANPAQDKMLIHLPWSCGQIKPAA